MTVLAELYRHSLTLLTDLYQLTMAYGYWRTGLADREAVFHLTFRRAPFGGQFAVACGLGPVVDYLRQWRLAADDLAYLGSLATATGRPLFEPPFLEMLAETTFRCDIDGLPEGTVVFAGEPLLRVRGPLLQCQLLETPLLTLLNFPTLVATKAARVCQAAQGQPVLEFGLRRAQGIDGGVSASRAAYIGGCAATSNVLAGKLCEIPVRGTHAHSWVMAFADERQAFAAYAGVLPDNCIFLVDTYNSLQGVQHAIAVGHELRRHGHTLQGIRLDSGDLAPLSRAARALLDAAGFERAVIVASGDLDELEIVRLRAAGACVDVWGVGTRLATAYDQPALGGVYKLAALRDAQGRWEDKLKLSEDGTKMSDPGLLQIRRLRRGDGRFLADVLYDERLGIDEPPVCVPCDGAGPPAPLAAAAHADLLVPIFRRGAAVYVPPSAAAARAVAQEQLQSLDDPVRRLAEPAPYRVGFEYRLHQLRQMLLAQTHDATLSGD